MMIVALTCFAYFSFGLHCIEIRGHISEIAPPSSDESHVARHVLALIDFEEAVVSNIPLGRIQLPSAPWGSSTAEFHCTDDDVAQPDLQRLISSSRSWQPISRVT